MDPMETIQGWEKAWNSGDYEKAHSYNAEDYALEMVPTGVVAKNKAEVRSYMDTILQAFPDLKFEDRGAIVSGNKAAWEYVMSGTQKKEFRGIPATGKSFSVRCCSILEFDEGGLFKRETVYLDVATMLRQLAPSPT